MARVKGGYTTRHRRKKIIKLAKGYFGSKHKLYKTAHEQVMHSMAYAYFKILVFSIPSMLSTIWC